VINDRSIDRVYKFELIVLALFLLPNIAFAFLGRTLEQVPFHYLALSSLFQNAAFAALIVFFVWRNREPWPEIGLSTRNWPQEVLVGILLFIPFSLAVGLIESLLRGAGLTAPPELPQALLLRERMDYLLALPFLVIVAFAEELIFRGYLIQRIGRLAGSLKAAVIISSVIFALGHGYQGALGVAAVGVMGVLFGVIYLWRGNLIAPMVMHFIQNFIGLIVAPLWSG
jgi:uncharacterized protein